MTRAAIGLGGNLGRPERAFDEALDALAADGDVRVVRRSRVWRSEPWGVADQPEFRNAAALVETSLAPEALLDRLHALERAAGRVRDAGLRWGPRVLDLDLLWFGDEVRDDPALRLPHPGLPERTFVLEPLAEIAPAWRHPRTGETPAGMLRALHAGGGATGCTPAPDAAAGDRP